MDFHNMKRNELQKLCKTHNLPANFSNLKMVENLSSLFEVQEKDKEKPTRKTRSCLKNSDEMLSENESDVLKRKLKKVRFSPQNDVLQLGEKSERGFVVESKGGAGRVTRGRASLCKTVLISPVVMKKRGKRAVQKVEKGGLVVENEGGVSRVTRARASLGEKVVISSPVAMKKRGKRAVQGDEKEDLVVENKGGASRVTRARELLGEKVLTSPVVMKKRGKKAVQEDKKGESVVENKGGASRVTRARAGKQVLTSSPVVLKKRGKRAVQEEKKSGSAPFLVIDLANSAVEQENEVITVKFLRNRKVENVVSPKNIVRKRNTQKRSQSINAEVSENKDAKADGGITQPKMGLRRSTRNVNISEESERLMDETDQKVSRKNLRQSTRQRASAKSNIEDVDKKSVTGEISQPEVVTRQSKRNRMEFTQVEPAEENIDVTAKAGRRKITRSRNQSQAIASTIGRESETRDFSEEAKEVVVQVKEPVRRSGRHVNTEHTNFANDSELAIKSDESIRYQTRRGTKRMSVMPQMKKAKTEKSVAGNLGKKRFAVKDSSNESTKPIVLEKCSETGDIRRSKRNASVDGSLVISKGANGSGTGIKTGTTKKRRRDAVLEEVPSQHTDKSVNRKADNISDKLEKETPVASEPRTRSGNRQNPFMHSAKKLNMSGNLGPSKTTGEKASPHHTRELSTVPKRCATGVRQSKTVAVTPRTRSGSGQKSFSHTTKKLRISGNSGLDKTIGDKESPHRSREFSELSRRFETESKVRRSKSKQTPVIHEHSRRFTRSALKGKTDGPAYVRGKIHQKKSQSISKIPLSKVESSLPKVISASEGPLDINVHSYHEIDRSTVNLVSNASDLPEDKTASLIPQDGSAKASSIDLNVQESEGPGLINIREPSPSDPLNLQSNHAEPEVDISTPQGGSAETSCVDINVQESEGPELINVCEASPSGPLNLQNNHAELEVDVSTPQGSSAKTSSVDLNMQESEGPELINILEASRSDPLKLHSDHAELEVDISSREHAPVVRPASYDVQSSIPQGCNTDPISDISNSCEDVDTCAILQDSATATATEANDKTPVHLGPVEGLDVAGDVASIDRNSVDDGFSSLEQITLKGMEVNPQTITYVEPGSGMITNIVLEGSIVHEEQSMKQLTFPKDGWSKIPVSEIGDVNEDNATATQRENSCETNVARPHLVHMKVDDTAGDAFPVDTNALADISVEDQSTLTRTEGRPQLSKDVESISKGIDLNLVFQGPAIHEDEPVHQSPLAEVAEITNNPVTTGNSDAACVTQQEDPTDIVAKSPPMVHVKSVDNVDIIGDAGSSDAGSVDDKLLNVEQIIASAIKGIQEVSKHVNHVVAEGSTVNEEKLTAEVGDCGPTEQEQDIRNHSDEFAESGGLDKNCRSASKEVGEAICADLPNRKVSMIFTEEKVDTMHPEISVQADEPHNTSSKSGMQEKEFPVPNSILKTEEVSILGYEISEPEFSNAVTSTVMCSNKKLAEDSNQRLSIVESCLMREEGCTNKCIEFSTSMVVADSVARGNNKSEPKAPSSPLRATEVGNSVVEVNEELKPEDSPLNWSSDILKRAAADGSSLQKECSAISADFFENNQSKNAKVESEIRNKISVFGSSVREMSDMPESISTLPSHFTEVGHLVAEGKELKPENSSSLWSTLNIPERAAEDGSSLHKQRGSVILTDGSERNQSEDARDKSEIKQGVSMVDSTVRELSEMPEFISVTQTSDFNIGGGKCTENELSASNMSLNKMVTFEVDTELIIEGEKYSAVGIEGREVEETVFEDTVEIDSERTSSMYGDAHHILDSCGKEQGTDMSMVKSSRNFGKEFSSQRDYCHRPLQDSCGKEQGTPMSMLKSSKNCGEEFSSQHDNIIEQMKVCHAATLPQTICEDFAGSDNQMVADLMGSTSRRISRTGALNNEKFEETEPCTVITDKIVLEDGIESLKGNSSNMVRNLVEDGGGYGEKPDAEIITYDVSEEDRYGKNTIDSHQFEDTLQQFDVNYGEDSNLKGICQENDERPYLVQMDVETNNVVESSRDNLVAVDTIHRFDQEVSGVPTEDFLRNEDAMDADASANLQYGGESGILTGETNEAQGVPTEELTRTEDAMDADAPANSQYGREFLTTTGETNQAQERGPEEISFFSDIFGSELNIRSDEVDGKKSQLWFEDTSFMQSEDAGKELDIFMVSPTKEQLHNSGEEHERENGPESIENQHTAFNNPSTGDVNVSAENIVGTLHESHLKSEANKDAHQKVDCCNNNKSDEDSMKTES